MLERFKKHAEEQGIRLSQDEKLVEGIIRGLQKREQKTGLPVCPCRRVTGDPETDKDNCCPCVHHLKEIEEDGECKCKLFVRAEP